MRFSPQGQWAQRLCCSLILHTSRIVRSTQGNGHTSLQRHKQVTSWFALQKFTPHATPSEFFDNYDTYSPRGSNKKSTIVHGTIPRSPVLFDGKNLRAICSGSIILSLGSIYLDMCDEHTLGGESASHDNRSNKAKQQPRPVALVQLPKAATAKSRMQVRVCVGLPETVHV